MDEPALTKDDLIKLIADRIEKMDNLPEHIMLQATNHYDHYSLLILIQAVLKIQS
jgi:hypothetical protein